MVAPKHENQLLFFLHSNSIDQKEWKERTWLGNHLKIIIKKKIMQKGQSSFLNFKPANKTTNVGLLVESSSLSGSATVATIVQYIDRSNLKGNYTKRINMDKHKYSVPCKEYKKVETTRFPGKRTQYPGSGCNWRGIVIIHTIHVNDEREQRNVCFSITDTTNRSTSV